MKAPRNASPADAFEATRLRAFRTAPEEPRRFVMCWHGQSAQSSDPEVAAAYEVQPAKLENNSCEKCEIRRCLGSTGPYHNLSVKTNIGKNENIAVHFVYCFQAVNETTRIAVLELADLPNVSIGKNTPKHPFSQRLLPNLPASFASERSFSIRKKGDFSEAFLSQITHW